MTTFENPDPAEAGLSYAEGAPAEQPAYRAQCVYCNTTTSVPAVVLQGHPDIGVCQPCHEHLKSATPVQRFALALQGIKHTMRELFNTVPLPRAIRWQLLRDALDDAERDLWAHIVEGKPLQRGKAPAPAGRGGAA
jgi:hypothetical protein